MTFPLSGNQFVILASIAVLLAVMVTFFTSRPATNESESYRFGSFVPVRHSSKAKWLVDGRDYMSAVADVIDAAKEEIFIAGWQLNPHIFMKRPDNGINSQHWRLDKLLLRKAEGGIHVYILLYWESKKIAGMDLGSEFVLSVLNHTNIKVRRHPHFSTLVDYPATMTRWSHHEKVRLNLFQKDTLRKASIYDLNTGQNSLDNSRSPFPRYNVGF